MTVRSSADVTAIIRSVPRTAAGGARLAAMLRQDEHHFHGLSTGEAHQLRAHVLAAFEERPHTEELRLALREELLTSQSPVVLAGAARALRRAKPDPEWRQLLALSSQRIELRDQYVAFEPGPARTAREEIAATIDALAAQDPGCCGPTEPPHYTGAEQPPFKLCPKMLGGVDIEDQDGISSALVPLLRDRPSVIAFFYTRCMNPAKCSVTVQRLGELARRLEAAEPDGWNILAITYDPDYDLPLRLRRFGQDRQFPISARARIVRCPSQWDAVRRAFGLRVGYGAATVNDHARECFVVTSELLSRPFEASLLTDPTAIQAQSR